MTMRPTNIVSTLINCHPAAPPLGGEAGERSEPEGAEGGNPYRFLCALARTPPPPCFAWSPRRFAGEDQIDGSPALLSLCKAGRECLTDSRAAAKGGGSGAGAARCVGGVHVWGCFSYARNVPPPRRRGASPKRPRPRYRKLGTGSTARSSRNWRR